MKYVIGFLLAAGISIVGLHSCGDDTPRVLQPILQLTGVVPSHPCTPCPPVIVAKTKTDVVAAVSKQIVKKKNAHFKKKKNAKKKFAGSHHHKPPTHAPSHTPMHGNGHAPTNTSHAPPTHIGLTGPPCCP
jgi:hypothetical protein